MDFGLTLIANVQQHKSDIVNSLSDSMSTFFEKKDYGNDIKSYTIGVVCVAPDFDDFFKPKKIYYTKGKKTIVQDGIPFILEDNLEYDIKLNFKDFTDADEKEARKMLANEILASLSLLEKLKKKIKDFDFDKFKLDMEKFFHLEGLISFG